MTAPDITVAKAMLLVLLAGLGSPSTTPIRFESRLLDVDEAAHILASMDKPVRVALALENGVAAMTVRRDSTREPPHTSKLLSRISGELGPADSVRISSEGVELDLSRLELREMVEAYRFGSPYGLGANRLHEADTNVKWIVRATEAGWAYFPDEEVGGPSSPPSGQP